MPNLPKTGVVEVMSCGLALALMAVAPTHAAEEQPEILLLRPPRDATGIVRVGALTDSNEVSYVAFFLDDFLVAAAHNPPHDASIDLGTEPTPKTLRAVAFDRSAQRLAEASFTFGVEPPASEIEIVEISAPTSAGRVAVSTRVDLRPGQKLRHVEFFWNSSLVARRAEPPFRVQFEVDARRPADHLRTVAVLADGQRLETARLADGDAPGDRVDVNLVELYAVVTDRLNRPRSGLLPEDFTVSEAGLARSIERFAPADEVPLSLGLAIDTSDSMKPWLAEARAAGAAFFETTLREQDRAFLVEFDDRPRLAQPLTDDPDLLRQRLAEVELGGDTAFYDAILFSIAQFEGVGGRKALVVLTDGEDYGSHYRPEHCIEQAVAHGVQIYLIDLNDPMKSARRPLTMLNQRIVKETGGRIYSYASRSLEEIYSEIRSELQSQYLLAWSSERRLSERELRNVKVKVRNPKLSVRAVPAHHVQRR